MKRRKPVAILSHRLYVPSEYVTESMLRAFTRRIFINKQTCIECGNDDPAACRGCRFEPTLLRFYKEHSGGWHSFASGDLGKIYSVFADFSIEDNRSDVPLTIDLKWGSKKLWPNQRDTVREWMEFKYGIIKSAPRSGKCVSGNTLVSTDQGIIPIKKLFSTDHADGEARQKVLGIISHAGVAATSYTYKKRVCETYRMVTHYGYVVEGTPEHPVMVLTPSLNYVWKRLDTLCEGDYVCINRKHSLWASQDYDGMYPDVARILGYLVANGCLHTRPHSFSFCSDNVLVQKDFIRLIKKVFAYDVKIEMQDSRAWQCHIHSIDIKRRLQNLGLLFVASAAKEIPFSVMQSTKPVMQAFIEAYVSCDSALQEKEVELCSASKKLIWQLQIVFTNFGVVSRRSSKQAYAKNSASPHVKRYHRLFITGTSIPLFYAAFGFLKPVPSVKRRYAICDTVPYVRSFLTRALRKHHLGSGVYLVNGKRQRLQIVPDRHPERLMMTHETLHKINFANLTLLDAELSDKLQRLRDDGFFFDPVKSVKKKNKPTTVYDLTVPTHHSFVANGVVVHNTIMFANIVCKLKQKVLIVAKQREWLDQFIVAFRDFTNISELEAADKKTYIGWIKKWPDIDNLQIAVVTYQKFIRHPEIVKKYRDAFGIVFVDECDQVAAKCFHKVVNGFSAKYRFGATGTDKRKDQLHVIANHVLGPVTVKGKSKQLPCKVTYHYTGFKVGKFAQWNTFIKRITKDRKRTDFILDRVKRDVALGRWVVLVTDRVAHAQLMTRLLQNDEIEAETFWGGMKDRKELFAKAKRGEIRVVVAIRKLIQRGIDVTWWDSIHICTPTANVHNYTQEVARVRTPYEGKPTPTIHFYLDVGDVSHAVKSIAERVHQKARGQE